MSNQETPAPAASGPNIAQLTPSSGPIAGGTVVTISGSGFEGATVVLFGTAGATPSVNGDGTVITVTAPATSAGGVVDVRVNVPTGKSPVVVADRFTYTAPAVTQVSPANGPQRGGTTVTVSGTELGTATQVLFGGVPATPVSVTDSQVVAVSPMGQVAGAVDVQVVVVSGVTPVVTEGKFAYIPPSVTGLSPGTGPISGGTTVTLDGNGLTGATAVNFGAVGATPLTVTDTAITVTTPVVTAAGGVDVRVSLPSGPVAAPVQFKYYTPAPVNVLFVVDNRTGVPDDLVYVKFLGAEIVSQPLAQTYGDGLALATGAATSGTSYSLAAMTAQVAGAPGLPAPVFRLNDYAGGRIYFSLGAELQSTTIPAAQDPTDKDFHTVYGYVEPSVFPAVAAGQTNIDASYVDFIGIPFDISVRKRSDGTLLNPPANNPLSTPAGQSVFAALTADPNVPAGTQVAANTSAVSPAAKATVTIGGTARILAPSLYQAGLIRNAQAYHDWTGSGGLIASLTAGATTLSVSSYTTVGAAQGIPKATLFGFAGSKVSNIGAAWTLEQDYALTAQALADLNPKGANTRLPALEGIAGVKLSGSGGVVGRFDVYIANTDLDAQTGIYGANPDYVVDWRDAPGGAGAYTQLGIQNDLGGRVVGDLLAGFNFGWAGCAVTVTGHAQATGTAANLVGSVFDPAAANSLGGKPIGALSTGEFFYLLSLQPSTVDLAQWFGAAIQSGQPTWYNNYASDFQALTNCYNMAFTDRLQGRSDPDMFFAPSEDSYVRITLQPGAYTVTSIATGQG